MANQNGKLIVIDGLDGSGKATQTKILVNRLKTEGHEAETLDFPQYTQNFFGGMVRQYLDGKFGPATKVDPRLASLLYAADRWESSEKIKQWLAADKIVILDRYYTSNLIHQTPKLEEAEIDDFISWIEKMELEIFKIPKPDLVLYLHVDAQTSHNLIAKRGQGHDGHDELEYMKLTEKRCQFLTKKLGWRTVECCQTGQILSIEKIAQLIWSQIFSN